MTAFAGIVALGEAPIPSRWVETIQTVVAGLASARHAHIRKTSRAVFAHASQPSFSREGTLFAATIRLDNHTEIAAVGGASENAGDAECIRRIFERYGDTGIAKLLGAFAFAHWEEGAATLTLARDCIGERALFYHASDGFVFFATDLAVLLALPNVPRLLDERMLANFLALNHRERETTFYRGIVRVPSRTVVRITPGGTEQRHYWSPDVNPVPPFVRDEDYVSRARELFDQAVARSLRAAASPAIFLSGGFDSSAIAATAARLGVAEITGYTGLAPDDLDRPARPGWHLDERSKVEALARLYPSMRIVFVTPRGAHLRQSDSARFFPIRPIPQRGVANLGWFAQIEDVVAGNGHSVVLQGGLGNLTISWDGRFLLSHLLHQGSLFRLITAVREIAQTTHQSPLRVIAREAVRPLLPQALQRFLSRLRGFPLDDVSAFSLLRREIVDELDLRRQWHEQGFDPAYRIRGTSAQLRAHQIFDQLQLSRDVGGMDVDRGGIERRDPYSDRELIEFCLSVPETLFQRDGIKRWFARQVFADRLPPEILNENRRGEQAPNWFESLSARKPIIVEELERLQSSRLASRLIDLPRLKHLIDEWPKDVREAESRAREYRLGLDRAIHVGQFIRWVEGGNA